MEKKFINRCDGIYDWNGKCRCKQELGCEATVVATGGMAVMIAEESNVIDKLDGLLTLKGLRLIYERNKEQK